MGSLTYVEHLVDQDVHCLICLEPVAAEAVRISCHERISCSECISLWFGSQLCRRIPTTCPHCRAKVDVSNLRVFQPSSTWPGVNGDFYMSDTESFDDGDEDRSIEGTGSEVEESEMDSQEDDNNDTDPEMMEQLAYTDTSMAFDNEAINDDTLSNESFGESLEEEVQKSEGMDIDSESLYEAASDSENELALEPNGEVDGAHNHFSDTVETEILL